MEQITRPNLSYWQDAWRRIKKNKVAFCSLLLILLVCISGDFCTYVQSVWLCGSGFLSYE